MSTEGTLFPVRVDGHVAIAMDDGVRLAATIYRPDAPGAFPALLESIPYRKDDWTLSRDRPVHAHFAARGYASVRLDIRGSGSSEGIAEDEYAEREILDNLAVLAWLREQPWCDGALGMFGISWGGFSALQAAMRRPPGLGAIIPVGATHDRYELDVHYIGGTLHVNESVTWPAEMVAQNALPPDPARFGPGWRKAWLRRMESTPQWPLAWLRHQRRDAFWRHGSPSVDYAAIDVPVLAMNGFNDGYRDFVLELLEHLRVPRRGVLGPWGHSWPHAGWPEPSIDGLGLMTRWWDRWLKGIDNGVDREPMLAAYLAEPMPAEEYPSRMPGRWWFTDEWPLPGRPETRRWLGATGELGDRPPSADATGGITWAGPPWVGLRAPFWAGSGPPEGLPLDQRADEARALCWTSEPLPEALAIVGRPVAELWLSASEPVAQVAVKMADVAPDGTSALVGRGLLNLTHRGGHDAPAPLVPGRVERVEVVLQASGAVIAAGHRLRVAIAGADWPLAWPPPRPATLTLHADAEHPSGIRLPLATGMTTDGPELGAPGPLDHEVEELPALAPRSSVERRADGGWLLTLEHGEAFRVPSRGGLVWRAEERLRISIGASDPTSCRAEGTFSNSVDYPGGPTVGATGRIVQTSDETHVHVLIELRATEDGAPVFERSWRESFERDLL